MPVTSVKYSGFTQTLHFDSVRDMLLAADKAQKVYYHKGSQGGVTRPDFIGRKFSSWQDCWQKAHEPWQEGIDAITNMIEKLEHETLLPKPKNIRRRATWSEEDGDEVCLERLRNGGAYWRKMQRREVAGAQTVSIFCTVNAPGKYDASWLLWRGVAAIVLAHLLETAGYRCEMFAVRHVGDAFKNHDASFMSCKLKEARQPLDVASIVNAISGWMYRTIWMQAQYSIRTKEVKEYMGISYATFDSTKEVVDLAGKNEAYVIDGCFAETTAIAKIKDVVRRVNREPEPPLIVAPESSNSSNEGYKKVKRGRRGRPRKAKIDYYGDAEE